MEKREAFIEWNNEHKYDPFDFHEQLMTYCKSDVDILRKGCLAFRKMFMEATSLDNEPGVDPFENCLTIASSCNFVFRRNFLELRGKLMFGLCGTCMEDGVTENCCHDVDSRTLTVTWVSDEINKAIQKGYKIEEIYEVWHFENVSQYDPLIRQGGAFTEYKYIEDYYTKEGIRLDARNINWNPGLRQLAKLMLNSFWGKFGQRLNLPRSTYLTDPAVYFDILTSDSQEVQDVSFVTDDMVRINWINQSQFIEETGRNNVVIAAYTTTQARLELYSYLENLGERALYCDTDSIIFSSKPGDWMPDTGDYFGDLTDETPNNTIECFITG
ncbi:unnamed protein product [Mytilus coruscus]|uniref:DNA-directed DNA polymerase n=1 Tax=Mytilus coruscus TaxID=42192 RepID=A0A6J8E011_MYTCO|nr:unnamed protein product [Mytilus coruscus]